MPDDTLQLAVPLAHVSAGGAGLLVERLLGTNKLSMQAWPNQNPERMYWTVTVLRLAWCMVAPALLFASLCSIELEALALKGAPDCNLFGQSSDQEILCEFPISTVFNFVLLFVLATVYTIIIWSSRDLFRELRDGHEMMLIDVAVCFHINAVLAERRTRYTHYFLLLFILVAITVSLATANIQNSDGSVTNNAGLIILNEFTSFVLLVISSVKMLESPGYEADKLTFDLWCASRASAGVPTLHPVASVLTRSMCRTVNDETSRIFIKFIGHTPSGAQQGVDIQRMSPI